VLGAGEQRERPILGQSLGDVHELAAAVVPLARKPSAYLLVSGEPCASMTAGEGVVLAGDQLDLPALAIGLAANGRPQLGVDIGQPAQAIPSRRAIVIVAPYCAGSGGSSPSGDTARSSYRASGPGSLVLSPIGGGAVSRGIARHKEAAPFGRRFQIRFEGPLAESWPHPAGSDERGGCSEPAKRRTIEDPLLFSV